MKNKFVTLKSDEKETVILPLKISWFLAMVYQIDNRRSLIKHPSTWAIVWKYSLLTKADIDTGWGLIYILDVLGLGLD